MRQKDILGKIQSEKLVEAESRLETLQSRRSQSLSILLNLMDGRGYFHVVE